MIDRSALAAALSEVALLDSSVFPEKMLDLLVQRLSLTAATLYLTTEDATGLRVRAIAGDPDLGDAIQFATDAPLTRAVLASGSAVGGIHDSVGLYDDAINVPLSLDGPGSLAYRGAETQHRSMGALRLIPRDRANAHEIAERCGELRQFISQLYLATVDRRAMELRRIVVERVAYRRDIGSLAHNYLQMAKHELSFEGAALWVLDAQRNLLYRRRALHPRSNDTSTTPQLLRPDANSLLAECFRTQTAIWHDAQHPRLAPDDVDLACESVFSNWTAMPIRLPPDARLAGRRPPAAGVLEFVNHYTDLAGQRWLTSLTWEDQYLADFTGELLSVLIYQILRSQDHESDYERMLHGAKTSLLAARSRLQALERYELERYIPPSARHYIPNAIDWLQDLESQINRDDLVSKTSSELTAISLYGDVLAKLEVMLSRINAGAARDPISLIGLDAIAQTYHQIPRVVGNRQALDCVFRNLLDNCAKYCWPPDGQPPEVSIRVLIAEDRSDVVILLSDNGLPIPAEEADMVFEDGFRGDLAQGVEPQGLGRGLFDCKRLMEEMGGTISVIPGGVAGVTFRLELRAASTQDAG